MKPFIDKSYIVICLLIIAAGTIIMWPNGLHFLLDDFIHLKLTSQGQWFQHHFMRLGFEASLYLDHYLYGFNAFGYHMTNFLLHIFCSILAWILYKKILAKYFPDCSPYLAFGAAILYYVYAFHAEPLFWVIGRTSSVANAMFLSSLIFYLNRHERHYYWALAGVFALLGFISYESTWIIPILFICISLYDTKFLNTDYRKELFFSSYIVLIFAACLFIKFATLGIIAGDYEAYNIKSLNVTTLARNYILLIIKSFVNLSVPVIYRILFIVLGVIVSLTAIKPIAQKQIPFLILLWLISYTAYVSMGSNLRDSEGERFLYIPSVFLCLIITILLYKSIIPRNIKPILFLCLLVLNLFLLNRSRNNYDLASATVKKTFEELEKLPVTDTLNFYNIPKKDDGALMFRYGLTEGVHLFTKHKTAYINEVSFNENESFDSIPNVVIEKNNVVFQ